MHGYARNEREEAILTDFGLNPDRVYLEGRGAEALGRIRMRSGEVLATVGGLRALGDSRQAIMAELARIHESGAVVFDVATSRRSDQNGAEMLDAALRRLRGESVMPPGKAEAMQAKSLKARIGNRMPARQAMTFWRDPNLTIGEALQRMPGWTSRSAYNHLGKRGLPVGPRGKRN